MASFGLVRRTGALRHARRELSLLRATEANSRPTMFYPGPRHTASVSRLTDRGSSPKLAAGLG